MYIVRRRTSLLLLALCLCFSPVLLLQAASRRPAPVDVSAGVAEGLLLQRSLPVYPAIAKAAHVSGAVILEAVISKDGTIENLRVVSGPALLQQAALQAVQTWRYRPFLLNGNPVTIRTQIYVIFTLDNQSAQAANAPSGTASDQSQPEQKSAPVQAASQPQPPQVAPRASQSDDGAAQRAALEQQKEDIADKIQDLQSDKDEQDSEAENWEQEAQQLGDTGNCTGPSASICMSIAQIGVNKAESHAREAHQAAQRDQQQIDELQGQSDDLDQQISNVPSAPAAPQPAYNPNALVDQANQQAAQMRAIGDANAAARANKNAAGSTGSPAGSPGQNSKGCVDQHGKPIPGSENWKACPGW